MISFKIRKMRILDLWSQASPRIYCHLYEQNTLVWQLNWNQQLLSISNRLRTHIYIYIYIYICVCVCVCVCLYVTFSCTRVQDLSSFRTNVCLTVSSILYNLLLNHFSPRTSRCYGTFCNSCSLFQCISLSGFSRQTDRPTNRPWSNGPSGRCGRLTLHDGPTHWDDWFW